MPSPPAESVVPAAPSLPPPDARAAPPALPSPALWTGPDAGGSLGLPDRAGCLRELRDRIASARIAQEAVAILAITVEAAGAGGAGPGRARDGWFDALAAARLHQACVGSEQPAHVGPGTFTVVSAWQTGPDASARLHRRALDLKAAMQAPLWLDDRTVWPRADIGVATCPDDGHDAVALLNAAAAAAQGAGSQGGVRFHGDTANAPALRAWRLGEALRLAIEQGGLQMLYQPKVSLDSGRIVGVEALLRWRAAGFGDVSPDEFMPLAAHAGLLDDLSVWSLRQACQQSVAWRRAGLQPLRIGVNISPLQRRLRELARQVQAVLIETGADPATLALEVNEACVLADVDQATGMLRELRALGIEIALDDFGTGSSSLAALQRLPIDVVNIDASLVHDITASPESVSMTRSIINMAHGMQHRVMAAGVETEGQLGLLSAKGCDLVQGDWFSPALTAGQVEQLVRAERALPPRLLRRRVQQRTLLLVDDDHAILAALKRLFRRDGYCVLTADGGEAGLARLAEQPVDVIVSDQRMPGMSGVEFLRQAKALYPDTVRLTLSGFTELQSIIDAVNEGAIYKFLTKPWDDDLLRSHVAEAFRHKELTDENRRLTEQVARANADLEGLNVQLAGLLDVQREQSCLLAASATATREMLDELPVAVLGIDPDGVVAYINRATARLLPESLGALGCAADEVLPRLLGHELPADGPAVGLRVGGRAYRAISQGMEPTPAAPLGRGRLVLLLESPCEAAA